MSETDIVLESPPKSKEMIKVWKKIVDSTPQTGNPLLDLLDGQLEVASMIFRDPETARSGRMVCKRLYRFVMEGNRLTPDSPDHPILFAKFISTNYLKEDYLSMIGESLLYPNIKLERVVNSDTFQLPVFHQLKSLDISSAGMTEWYNLSHLIGLQFLNLSETKISKLEPLSKLIQLKVLILNRTFVSSIHELSSLHQLQYLDLHWTKVEDISALSHLRQLKTLKLASTFVSSLEPLRDCTLLEVLEVHNTRDQRINDISPLLNMRNMIHLKLGNTQINDISSISNMENLVTLSLDHTLIRDIKPLSNLLNLRELDLSFTPELNSIDPLKSLHKLEIAHIGGNPSIDSSWFSSYDNWWPLIHTLSLNHTSVSNIEFINQMKQLEFLNIQGANVTDKSPLEGLVHLKSVLTEESKEKTAKAIYEYG